ncbi:MAG: response regulator [Candidatus Solibacter sp.]|jgi:DNA-binding response OmpR family regulator
MSRILLADDDAVQLDLHKQILEIAGYQVETALTASRTVRCIEKAPPDLTIMDLRFPNALGESDPREGMALIRRIRHLGYRAPVIVLSGWPADLYGQPEERLVSCILLKPVSIRELLHAIRGLLA